MDTDERPREPCSRLPLSTLEGRRIHRTTRVPSLGSETSLRIWSAAPRALAAALLCVLLVPVASAAQPLDGESVPIHVTESLQAVSAPASWPLTTGVPIAHGAIEEAELSDLVLTDDTGTPIPAQFDVRGSYPSSGHVRWLGVTFQAKAGTTAYTLRAAAAGESSPAHANPVQVAANADSIDVSNGVLSARIPKAGPYVLEWVKRNGATVLGPARANDYTHVDGRRFDEGNINATVEREGSLHSTIRVAGNYVDPDTGAATCFFTLRLHFYAGRPLIGVQHTFTWVGTQQDLQIREIALRFAPAGTKKVAGDLSADVSQGWASANLGQNDELALYQDVHDHWFQRTSHYALEHRSRSGTEVLAEGEQAGHWVTASDGDEGVTLVLKHLWQQFPKKLQVDRSRARLEALLWAPEGADFDLRLPALEEFWGPEIVERLQTDGHRGNRGYLDVQEDPARLDPTGMAKTHDLLLIFHEGEADASVERRADAFNHPPLALPDPAYIASTRVVGGLAARNPGRYPDLEANIDRVFEDAVHITDEWGDYGYFSYGQGPHAAYEDEGKDGRNATLFPRIWRYSNTEKNYELGIWRAYLRSGDPDLYHQAESHTRHVNDVMLCHDERNPTRHVGVYAFNSSPWLPSWLGYPNSHRGQRWLVPFGDFGFSIEHALWHYYLSGDLRSLEVFKEYAGGLKQGIIENGDENYAANVASSDLLNQGQSRDLYTQMANLAVAWQQLGDPWYRDRATDIADEFLRPNEVGGILRVPINRGEDPAAWPRFIFRKAPDVYRYARVLDPGGGFDWTRARDSLIKMAEWTYFTYQEGRGYQESRAVGPIMAAGHEYSGELRYLAFGLDILRQRHNATILESGAEAEETGTTYYTSAVLNFRLFPLINVSDPDADVNRSSVLNSWHAAMNGPHLMDRLDTVDDPATRDLLFAHYGSGEQGVDGWLPVYHKPYFWDHPFALDSPEASLGFSKQAGSPLVIELVASEAIYTRPDGSSFDPGWLGPVTEYFIFGDPGDLRRNHPLQHVEITVPAAEPAGVYTITSPADHQITVFFSNADFAVQ